MLEILRVNKPFKEVAPDAIVRHLKKEGGVIDFVKRFRKENSLLVSTWLDLSRQLEKSRRVLIGCVSPGFTATALA